MVMSYSPTNGNVIQPYQWRLVIQPYQWQCHTALRMALPCSPTNAWRKCTPIKLVLAGTLGHHPINKAVLSMLLQMRHHHLLDVRVAVGKVVFKGRLVAPEPISSGPAPYFA